MSLRQRVGPIWLILGGLVWSGGPLLGQTARLDLLIRGGSVYDGTGAAPQRIDIGIRGDRIVFVGRADQASPPPAARVIDAADLVVAPGFIDPHTHTESDLSRSEGRFQADYLMQGVTTVVAGNDGGGPVEIERTFAGWSRQGIGTNVALYVGHGTIRRMVLGMSDRPPTPAELDRMRALVKRAMGFGALGLSTGLYYAPASFATTGEVIALAKEAGRAGGIYDTHMRDESSYTIGLLGSIRETLEIGKEGGLPVHIAHIKALGADVWGQSDTVIALLKAARAAGQVVTADQYPYNASGTSISASLLPRWAEAGGRDSMLARIQDPDQLKRLRPEMAENLRRRGGPSSLLITGAKRRAWMGKTLEAVGQAEGVDPLEAALLILKEGDAGVASFNMKESDIEHFMVQDFVMTGSDGSSGHPRKFGTFPRKLAEYSLKRGVIPFTQAIHSSSGLTARSLQIADRGEIRVGAFADIVVFDSTALKDESTYEAPERLAVGMRYVLVNGRVAVDQGRLTRVLAGRPIRRATAPAASR
jgi:N-acyl-D-aspartate/D-glutamate deacylase